MRSLSQKTEKVSQKKEDLNNIKTELEALFLRMQICLSLPDYRKNNRFRTYTFKICLRRGLNMRVSDKRRFKFS
jgi:hypothetical protein